MTDKVKTVKVYRPVYKQNNKQMDVTFYNGSQNQKMVLENKHKEHQVAQELVKFFNAKATKNGGKIQSGDMLTAWLSAQGCLPMAEDDLSSISYNSDKAITRTEKIKRLDAMIQTACQDNSEGGTYVVQSEQFAILKALANWFTK